MADEKNKDNPDNQGDEGTGGTNDGDANAKPDTLGKSTEKAKADAQSAGASVKKEADAVAEEAREASSRVKDEATRAAGDVAETAQSQIQGAIEEQKNAGVERLQSIAEAIGRAGDELGKEVPVVGDALERAARELDDFAMAARDREPRELLDVAQDFARRQPALFAGALGLVGFAAVRFLTASSQPSSESKSMRKGVPGSGGMASPEPKGMAPTAPAIGMAKEKTKGAT